MSAQDLIDAGKIVLLDENGDQLAGTLRSTFVGYLETIYNILWCNNFHRWSRRDVAIAPAHGGGRALRA
jgi:hypothetical protein